MENNFEAILDESSEEEHTLSDDGNCNSDFDGMVVENEQVRAQNNRKICTIFFYYSTGGSLALCVSCMDSFRDDIGIMYAIRKHKVTTPNAVDGRWCNKCRNPLYIIIPCNVSSVYTLKGQ